MRALWSVPARRWPVLCVALIGAGFFAGISPAASAAGCPANEAADQVLQKKLKSIEAHRPDTSSLFDCLGDAFSKTPDLSGTIPDAMGILTSAAKAAMEEAQRRLNQACRAVRDTVNDVKDAPGDAARDANRDIENEAKNAAKRPVNEAGNKAQGGIDQQSRDAKDTVRYNVVNPIQTTGQGIFN